MCESVQPIVRASDERLSTPGWERPLEEVLDGNSFALPEFVQSLFHYLAIDPNEDVETAIQTVVVRAMHVMQKVQTIYHEKESAQPKRALRPSLYRDLVAVLCGSLFYTYPLTAALGILYIVYSSHEFNALTPKHQKGVLCFGVALASWHLHFWYTAARAE